MNKHPLISIITPSYNQGQFIRETIDSVLTQDYDNVELIVMDGGSTDLTVDVLKSFNDKRLSWISEPDNGQSEAINKGLKQATGDLFTWLNSDDVLLPGALRHVAEKWVQLVQPAVIYGRARKIDGNGADLGYCTGNSRKITQQINLARTCLACATLRVYPNGDCEEFAGRRSDLPIHDGFPSLGTIITVA